MCFASLLQLANGATRKPNESGVGLLMNLRKAANHPLLLRNHYDGEQIRVLARLLKRQDAGHQQAVEKFIREDLAVMSDFYIHKTCMAYRVSGEHVNGKSPPFQILPRLNDL